MSELGPDVELLHGLAAAQALPAAARLDAVPRHLLLLPGAQQAAAARAGDQGYTTEGGLGGQSVSTTPLLFQCYYLKVVKK